MKHPEVFSRDWFHLHQRKLVRLANSYLGRRILGINGINSSVDKRKVIGIEPNAIWWQENETEVTAEFRGNEKFGRRLYYKLYPLWLAFHVWDMLVAERFMPALDFGFLTLTAYPIAGANSPCDGPVNEVSVNVSFSTIRASAGNQGGLESTTYDRYAGLQGSTTTNQYQALNRTGMNFDTSSLGSTATISAAKISVVFGSKTTGLGSNSLEVVNFTPVSTASIPNTEFTNFGSTSWASLTSAGVTADDVTYNDFTLSAGGISNISKTGTSSFGFRIGWDQANSFGGVWASGVWTDFLGYYADNTGTAKDPKLTVTYTTSTFIAGQGLFLRQAVNRAGTY